MTIIRNLTIFHKNYVILYLTNSDFRIYKHTNNVRHFIEHYNSSKGLVKNYQIPTKQWRDASLYDGRRIHQEDPPYTRIKIDRNKEDTLLVFTDLDKNIEDTFQLNKDNNQQIIYEIQRKKDTIFCSLSQVCDIYISTVSSPDNKNYMDKRRGCDLSINVPSNYHSLFVHIYTTDGVYVGTRTTKKEGRYVITPPMKPYLKYDINSKCVYVSWASNYNFEYYSILRRRIDSKVTSWTNVGTYIMSPPINDCGVDTYHSGMFQYVIVGMYNGKVYMSDPNDIFIPSQDVMDLKPHVRATTNEEMSQKWRAPFILSC